MESRVLSMMNSKRFPTVSVPVFFLLHSVTVSELLVLCINCFIFTFVLSCWMSSGNNLIWTFVAIVSGIEIVSTNVC